MFGQISVVIPHALQCILLMMLPLPRDCEAIWEKQFKLSGP